LRVRRRGQIEGDGALQQRLVERAEIGQEAALARRRQIDRFAIGGERAGAIGGVERIGDQHRRHSSAAADKALGGERAEEQALARTVEHEHFGFRIDRLGEFVAAAEPGGDRLAERLDAFVGRIAAEFGKMRRQHRADEIGNRVLRLADRQVDRRLARCEAGNEIGQPHEGRAAAFGRRLGGIHFALGGHHGH
jgi:hypothetical protein